MNSMERPPLPLPEDESSPENSPTSLNPQELAANALKPPNEWSEKFKNYVAIKFAEHQQEEPESTPLTEQQEDYNKYLADLAFHEADLQHKRILDLGCGDDGLFVREVIDRKLTSSIWGIDTAIKPRTWKKSPYQEHLLRSDYIEKLPQENLDYITSYASVSLSIYQDPAATKEILQNALQALKPGGQIRLYPIEEARANSDLAGINEAYEEWLKLLADLAHEQGITWELEPIDINVAYNRSDLVWINKRLVITKPLAF